jgi:hypothetical protein
VLWRWVIASVALLLTDLFGVSVLGRLVNALAMAPYLVIGVASEVLQVVIPRRSVEQHDRVGEP